ncbi:dystrobrevin beta-like isoform X2 [Pomacea canaliculata]|uniref:dystrobrevin beta-like isoform X2 n=1 Tax=Pomacea canaliculata TaxID=400727 RepID=UPI000D7342C5|nr:dystrobrevin beta-like isoform X2 [Pomacea canaliculata]XP_025109385.1 dystrobrevin beta-like isoform X2 [Pomacea canaliculata]
MECLAVNQQRFASVIENINRELNQKGYLVGAAGEDMVTAADMPGAASKAALQQKQLLKDMRAQNFDVIRFATYRTACKLRFIQKRTNLHQVDIWNMIEAFRENGLNSTDAHNDLGVGRLEAVLTTVFTQLNKRLPVAQQINVEESVGLTLSWLLNTYDRESMGQVRTFAIKVSLSHMCAGKLIDKLRYIFTQISDSSGHMIWNKFDEYLRELLALPTAIFEGPSFGYTESASRSCFDVNSRVNVNDFLNVMMAVPGPQYLMWLPTLTRMAQVESVIHPVQCEGCHRASFTGFRYKCQQCFKYNLCQDCFWRGRTSGIHNPDHQMKEYTSYRSNTKQLGHSIKKSFQCAPHQTNHKLPHFPEAPEKTIDLSHIVPPTPVPLHNGFGDRSISQSADLTSIDSSSNTRSPGKFSASVDSCRIDDEHRLIARYAARLAADSHNASRSPTELHFNLDSSRAQRDLVAQLEAKNREIMREIQRLRLEQEAYANESSATTTTTTYNPTLLAELRLLRQRKDELESRMSALQESRKDLMVQLEGLMKLLKNHPTSPRSTPNSSPRSRSGLSPTFASAAMGAQPSLRSSGAVIPSLGPSPVVGVGAAGASSSTPGTPLETSLTGVGGDVRQAFQGPSLSAAHTRSLRNDLLVAADSVTNAMSSLVKELNSENSGSDNEDDHLNGQMADLKFEDDTLLRSCGTDEVESWRDDLQWRLKQESDFLAQLRARRQRSGTSSQTTSDNEQDGCTAMDDAESYVRTDDESVLATDDAESYVRTDEEQSVSFKTDEEAELYDGNPKEMTNSRYTTDEESYLQTDEESFIRTDEEDGGNTDWEESTQRWVNR